MRAARGPYAWLIRISIQNPAQFLPAAGKARHNGTDGDSQHFRRLGIGEVLDRDEQDHAALLLRQLGQGAQEVTMLQPVLLCRPLRQTGALGVLDGGPPPAAGSIIRITHAEIHHLEFDTVLSLVGSSGVVDGDDDLIRYGERYLSRQTAALGGGTTEIARNIIGERVLGFPREYAADRGVPFNQVKRNKSL